MIVRVSVCLFLVCVLSSTTTYIFEDSNDWLARFANFLEQKRFYQMPNKFSSVLRLKFDDNPTQHPFLLSLLPSYLFCRFSFFSFFVELKNPNFLDPSTFGVLTTFLAPPLAASCKKRKTHRRINPRFVAVVFDFT